MGSAVGEGACVIVGEGAVVAVVISGTIVVAVARRAVAVAGSCVGAGDMITGVGVTVDGLAPQAHVESASASSVARIRECMAQAGFPSNTQTA